VRPRKLSKPQGEGNKILKDSESLGSLSHFDEIIGFDKIVEPEKMLALRGFLKYKMIRAKLKKKERRR
jgi:hypothetical protein